MKSRRGMRLIAYVWRSTRMKRLRRRTQSDGRVKLGRRLTSYRGRAGAAAKTDSSRTLIRPWQRTPGRNGRVAARCVVSDCIDERCDTWLQLARIGHRIVHHGLRTGGKKKWRRKAIAAWKTAFRLWRGIDFSNPSRVWLDMSRSYVLESNFTRWCGLLRGCSSWLARDDQDAWVSDNFIHSTECVNDISCNVTSTWLIQYNEREGGPDGVILVTLYWCKK